MNGVASLVYKSFVSSAPGVFAKFMPGIEQVQSSMDVEHVLTMSVAVIPNNIRGVGIILVVSKCIIKVQFVFIAKVGFFTLHKSPIKKNVIV